jgi:hypothetical protein
MDGSFVMITQLYLSAGSGHGYIEREGFACFSRLLKNPKFVQAAQKVPDARRRGVRNEA